MNNKLMNNETIIKDSYKCKDILYLDYGMNLHTTQPKYVYKSFDPLMYYTQKVFEASIKSTINSFCTKYKFNITDVRFIYNKFINKEAVILNNKCEIIEEKGNNKNIRVFPIVYGCSFEEYITSISDYVAFINS